jgi:phosphinothricin acetyltransferase
VLIRDATEADLPGILAIYNDVIATSTAVYTEAPATLEDRQAWLGGRAASGFPVLAAVEGESERDDRRRNRRRSESRDQTMTESGMGERKRSHPALVLGFASFGDFRPWPGYRHTVEHSVHVAEPARGQGIGTALVAALLPRASSLGKHMMIAGIDAANAASIRMHERLGFERSGVLREVGRKFDRWLDLLFMQRRLP